MTDSAYFFDTYAFFEIFKDNPNYEPFRLVKVMTTIFNLAEMEWVLQREKRPYASSAVRNRAESLVDVTIDDLTHAMQLRLQNTKLSIPDVIGYVVAKRHGVKFLTGDKEFEGMENVEFVK